MGLILGPLTLGWLPLDCSNRSAQIFIHASCCCTVRFWGPSWQYFSHPQLFIQYRMISWFMFSSSAIIFTVNLQLDHLSSFTCAVLSSVHVVDGHLLHCSTSTRFLASENILCQQKGFTLDIVISKGVPKFSICCGSILTTFNTKNYGIPSHDIPCFHFNKVHKHIPPYQALTPDWGATWTCLCEWGLRRRPR